MNTMVPRTLEDDAGPLSEASEREFKEDLLELARRMKETIPSLERVDGKERHSNGTATWYFEFTGGSKIDTGFDFPENEEEY